MNKGLGGFPRRSPTTKFRRGQNKDAYREATLPSHRVFNGETDPSSLNNALQPKNLTVVDGSASFAVVPSEGLVPSYANFTLTAPTALTDNTVVSVGLSSGQRLVYSTTLYVGTPYRFHVASPVDGVALALYAYSPYGGEALLLGVTNGTGVSYLYVEPKVEGTYYFCVMGLTDTESGNLEVIHTNMSSSGLSFNYPPFVFIEAVVESEDFSNVGESLTSGGRLLYKVVTTVAGALYRLNIDSPTAGVTTWAYIFREGVFLPIAKSELTTGATHQLEFVSGGQGSYYVAVMGKDDVGTGDVDVTFTIAEWVGEPGVARLVYTGGANGLVDVENATIDNNFWDNPFWIYFDLSTPKIIKVGEVVGPTLLPASGGNIFPHRAFSVYLEKGVPYAWTYTVKLTASDNRFPDERVWDARGGDWIDILPVRESGIHYPIIWDTGYLYNIVTFILSEYRYNLVAGTLYPKFLGDVYSYNQSASTWYDTDNRTVTFSTPGERISLEPYIGTSTDPATTAGFTFTLSSPTSNMEVDVYVVSALSRPSYMQYARLLSTDAEIKIDVPNSLSFQVNPYHILLMAVDDNSVGDIDVTFALYDAPVVSGLAPGRGDIALGGSNTDWHTAYNRPALYEGASVGADMVIGLKTERGKEYTVQVKGEYKRAEMTLYLYDETGGAALQTATLDTDTFSDFTLVVDNPEPREYHIAITSTAGNTMVGAVIEVTVYGDTRRSVEITEPQILDKAVLVDPTDYFTYEVVHIELAAGERALYRAFMKGVSQFTLHTTGLEQGALIYIYADGDVPRLWGIVDKDSSEAESYGVPDYSDELVYFLVVGEGDTTSLSGLSLAIQGSGPTYILLDSVNKVAGGSIMLNVGGADVREVVTVGVPFTLDLRTEVAVPPTVYLYAGVSYEITCTPHNALVVDNVMALYDIRVSHGGEPVVEGYSPSSDVVSISYTPTVSRSVDLWALSNSLPDTGVSTVASILVSEI
jgi:hypothetical protein